MFDATDKSEYVAKFRFLACVYGWFEGWKFMMFHRIHVWLLVVDFQLALKVDKNFLTVQFKFFSSLETPWSILYFMDYRNMYLEVLIW